ncbi:MAG: nucleotidyltransferase family protein [Planctomycetota bacterium]|nr:nucleotidyltransferase family protein [Planctomycetota bacterium]
MLYHGIQFDQKSIAAFCQRHQISRLSLYGSILRDDFRPDSDIDVLVEFTSDAKVSLFDLGGMLMELRDMLGRDVDLRTPQDLSRHFRDQVLHESKVLYAA